MEISTSNYLIVDWGTTNFRAFLMDVDHKLVDTKEDSLGLLQIENGQFAETLEKVLADWLNEYQTLPIYMAGMVGSAKGWVNVPYAQTSAGKEELVAKAHKFLLPWGAPAVIIPGVCHNSVDDQYDVMRGEEVQIIGLGKLISSSSFDAILPGTHSKHSTFKDNKITYFASYLTGELYSVLLQHTLLGKGLPTEPAFDKSAFLKGVKEGQSEDLTNKIFLAWTHRLFKNLNESQIPDYLSGLLIGFEFRKVSYKTVNLVGGHSLSKRYVMAAEFLGIQAQTYSGNECFLAGMSELILGLQK